MFQRPALLRRLPRLWWRPRSGEQVVSPDIQSQYPALSPDFGVLEQELLPQFRNLDNDALRSQNTFRLFEVILILGSVAATTLGAIQTARGQDVWLGVTEAVLSALLAGAALIVGELKPQEEYFTKRLKAEMLRGEYFLFLGRITPYTDAADRVRRLRRRVAEIVTGEEMS